MAGHLNYLSIVTAAVTSWLFGAIYYMYLGRRWIAAQGKTMESLAAENAAKSSLAKAGTIVSSFVAELIMGAVIYGILTHSGLWSFNAGVVTGVLCWFGFVATTVSVNYAYSGRSLMLTVIDSVHWLGALILLGGIIGSGGP